MVNLLIKIKNKRGPSILPCGTPLVTGKKDDIALLIQTHWHLFVMKAQIHLKVLFAKPCDSRKKSILHVTQWPIKCFGNVSINYLNFYTIYLKLQAVECI